MIPSSCSVAVQRGGLSGSPNLHDCVGLPSGFGSMLPLSATTLPVRSQDWAKGRRRRLDLSRGRGCRPIRSPSNWLLFRGCPIFGSTLGSLARNVWFATVLCNDRFAASQDDAMRISCQSDLFWRRVQTTGYLYSTPLRSGCRAVDGPHSLLSSPRSQDGDAGPQGLAVSTLDRRQTTDVVERGRTLGRQSPDRSVERQSRRRQSWLHGIARSCAHRQPSMHEVPGRKVRCPRC